MLINLGKFFEEGSYARPSSIKSLYVDNDCRVKLVFNSSGSFWKTKKYSNDAEAIEAAHEIAKLLNGGLI